MRWPTKAQSRGWRPPLLPSATGITLRDNQDSLTPASSGLRGLTPSELRIRHSAFWQPPREPDSRPPDVGVATVMPRYALYISPLERGGS